MNKSGFAREAHDAINWPRDWCRKEIEEATAIFGSGRIAARRFTARANSV